MKVKVSYTVGLDDVPDLVDELLASVRQELISCSQKLKFKTNDMERMVQEFQEVRARLDVAYSQIKDAMQIAIGYESALEEAQQGLNPEPTEAPLEEV